MCNTSKGEDFQRCYFFWVSTLCRHNDYVYSGKYTYVPYTYNVYLHIPANIKSTISYNYNNRGKHTYSPQVQISGKNPKIVFRTKSPDLVTIGD